MGLVFYCSAPDRGAKYCDKRARARVCVCLSVRDYIFGTARPIFTKFCMRVSYGCGSVLLWRRNYMLCASGFIFLFAHNPRLIDVAAQLKPSEHADLGLAINCAQ